MSKIICSICGTAYSDTEPECPICGFEKPETAEFAGDDTIQESAAVTGGHVKGGRFTKSNMKKRTTAPRDGSTGSRKHRKKNESTLLIAVIVLLVGVVIAAGYIYFKFFAGEKDPVVTNPPVQTTTEDTQPEQTTDPVQTTTEPVDLSCTGLELYEKSVVLNSEGSQWLLNVVPTPANTSDTITYSSADKTVATVSESGNIVAVGNGETVITITCGSVSVECKVICELTPVPTQPEETQPEETQPEETQPEETQPEETQPEETQPEETQPENIGDFKLNREDFTLAIGESWRLYNGTIDSSEITWRSSNSAVATVWNGRVKGVGVGYAWITAEYNGVKLKCIVYVE